MTLVGLRRGAGQERGEEDEGRAGARGCKYNLLTAYVCSGVM